MKRCKHCDERYSAFADARACPDSRGLDHEWVELTDVCEECGESGRDIARAGHLIGCSKNPHTKWPEVRYVSGRAVVSNADAVSICEELIPAPTNAELREQFERDMGCDDEYYGRGDEQIPAGRDAQEFIAECIAEATGQEPPGPKPLLPTDSLERKNTPICTGVFDYFPKALAYVSQVSKAGNDKHNPGQPLHWAKDKSTDHPDCIARHLIERGTRDPEDGKRHSGKLAWRALANLEIELEEAEKNGESW